MSYLDLSILDKFGFEYPAVGVKYSLIRPTGMPKLGKKLAICEMLREAQLENAFYATVDNHACKVGPYLLGQVDPDPVFESGQVGPKLGVYSDPRANRRIYLDMPKLVRDTANYTLFASVNKMDFDPDVLIITAKPSQAEVILRAKGYRNGSGWNAKGTSVAGCAFLYMYPYITGELNMMVTGLHHGMKARHTFPEGLLFLSIPYQVLPEILNNLKEMVWDLPQYSWGKEAHMARMKQIAEEVNQEIERSESQK